MGWIAIFIIVASCHRGFADTFNVQYLPIKGDRKTDTIFAAATMGLEDYIKDHPNSTLFKNHEIK